MRADVCAPARALIVTDTVAGLLQVALLIAALAAVYKPLGDYMARAYLSAKHWRVERALYKVVRVDPTPTSAGPPTPRV